jgi:uncharacterized membrane protein
MFKSHNIFHVRPALLLVIAILTGMILRVACIDTQGYWYDEIYSLAGLNGFDAYLFEGSDLRPNSKVLPAKEYIKMMEYPRFLATLERNIIHEGHPPLYQLTLKAWSLIAGTSETSLRGLSSFAALMTLFVIYRTGEYLESSSIGAKAALLLAISPFHIFFSNEARSYTLGIMFCSLATLAGVAIAKELQPKNKFWAMWVISVACAFYTHYYAGIYCAILALIIAPTALKTNLHRILWVLPFGLFLIWLPFLFDTISLQSTLHWTHGLASFSDSMWAIPSGLVDILTGPRHSATQGERLFAIGLLIISLWGLAVKNTLLGFTEKKLLFLTLGFPLSIYVVDIVTNHHTILIPRYFSFCQPALVLMMATYLSRLKMKGNILLAIFVIVSIHGSLLTINGIRAPKQMLKEAAFFINKKYTEGDHILVTPNGPTLLGLSVYLNPSLLLGAVSEENIESRISSNLSLGRNTWLVRQKLGSEPIPLGRNTASHAPLTPNSFTRFVGLDLYKYDA